MSNFTVFEIICMVILIPHILWFGFNLVPGILMKLEDWGNQHILRKAKLEDPLLPTIPSLKAPSIVLAVCIGLLLLVIGDHDLSVPFFLDLTLAQWSGVLICGASALRYFMAFMAVNFAARHSEQKGNFLYFQRRLIFNLLRASFFIWLIILILD